jgi:predicted regulator of Ras-like GTPase activity (Roadblock/LC7/MglB family)
MRSQHSRNNYYNLRSGITIYPAQDKAIAEVLAELRQKLPAHFLLLTDVTGQVISARGDQNQIDLVVLGSLVAGDLAASQEIARLTGEYQDYQMVLREGQKTHTFIIEAGHHLALLVQVSNEVPLGWARMLIQKVARHLADIIALPPEEEVTDQAPPDLGVDQEDLPDLFDEALAEMWQE